MVTSRVPIKPRYAETSQMGLVPEACYPRWLDVARAALLREQGLDFHHFRQLGYLLPVLEIGLTFHRPAFYDDDLEILTFLRSRPTFRIRLEYEVRRGRDLLATGFSVQGFVNRHHRPVKPPAAFLAKLDAVFPRQIPADPDPAQNSTAGP